MNFHQSAEDWRRRREDDLRAEFGWLSLAGLFFLSEGENPVGPDHVVTVARAPGVLGSFVLESGEVTFVTPQGLWWPLTGDRSGAVPSRLRFGETALTLIWRQERWAVRLHDNKAPTRIGFSGLDWYPPDSAWKIQGRWEAFDPPLKVTIRSILGGESSQEFHGRALLETPSGPVELLGQREGPQQVFLNFRDQSSGGTTYGSGRFLDALLSDQGIEVDFNRAYNPPCAFTAFATCPLPPRENHLPFAVPAGEKLPPGHASR